MNWLDSLIGWISPAAGAKRTAWRQAMEEMRSYDAGAPSRLNAGWSVFNQSAENTDRYNRDQVKARARDLERNSDIMNSVLGAYKRNVVGSGFTLQAKTINSRLNKEIEALWKQWCKARNCDVTGTQSFTEILRMAVIRKKVDGGILFVKRYTRDGIVPFKLQMVEVDELATMQTGPKYEGDRVVGGIEYNSFNKPVGYWIQQYQIDGWSIVDPVFVKANDCVFYFTKRRPSQIREMSDMSPTVTRIRDTNEFMTAVSVKERINACLSVFIKKQLPPVGIGRSGSNAGNAGRHDYDGKTLTPGMIKELNAGDEVQVVNPTGQSADATSFTKLQQRLIGAGQGLSYEATSRDMSETNYASARQSGIEDGLSYDEEIEKLAEVLDEIFETFLVSAVLCGRIQIRDFWEKKETYFEHAWIKAPKKWIDPLKESNATKTALATGVKTFQEIAAENGHDWRQQIDDMAEAIKYGTKKGIDLGGILYNGQIKKEAAKEATQGSVLPAGETEGSGETGGEDNGSKTE